MQLISIDQCKVGMTVWHPIYGKGEIVTKAKISLISVQFNDYPTTFLFWDTAYIVADKFNLISHLYTEPVYICEKALVPHRNDFGDHEEKEIYLPINPDQ